MICRMPLNLSTFRFSKLQNGNIYCLLISSIEAKYFLSIIPLLSFLSLSLLLFFPPSLPLSLPFSFFSLDSHCTTLNNKYQTICLRTVNLREGILLTTSTRAVASQKPFVTTLLTFLPQISSYLLLQYFHFKCMLLLL